jgi:hypothetical protein
MSVVWACPETARKTTKAAARYRIPALMARAA